MTCHLQSQYSDMINTHADCLTRHPRTCLFTVVVDIDDAVGGVACREIRGGSRLVRVLRGFRPDENRGNTEVILRVMGFMCYHADAAGSCSYMYTT